MKNTKTILAELLLLDPSLKMHKEALTELIEEIQKSRPNITWDKQFYKSLRAEILSELPQTQSFSFMKSFTLAFAVLLLVAIPTSYYLFNAKVPSDQLVAENTAKTEFTPIEPNAFGTLNLNTNAYGNGLGGGGDLDSNGDARSTQYVYTYTGDTLPSLASTMDVIAPAPYTEQEFNDFLASKNLTDWNNSGITNFNFNVAIQNPNWKNLCGSYLPCDGEDENTLKVFPQEELLSDDEILGIFNTFMADHHLATDTIGTFAAPFISDHYENGITTYSPLATLNYDLMINGHTIYGLSGVPLIGAANVDMVNKEVMDFQSLTPEKFITSAYATATNDELFSAAKFGGLDNSGLQTAKENSSDTVSLNLGTPTINTIQMLDTSTSDYKSYYAPAYFFPVLDAETSGAPHFVIVPLVKDLLSQLDQSW